MLASRTAAPSGLLRQRRIHFPNKQPELTETPPSAPPPPPLQQPPPPLPPPLSFPPHPATAQAQRPAPPVRSRSVGRPRPRRARAPRMRSGSPAGAGRRAHFSGASQWRLAALRARKDELLSSPNGKKPRMPEKPGRGLGRTGSFNFQPCNLRRGKDRHAATVRAGLTPGTRTLRPLSAWTPPRVLAPATESRACGRDAEAVGGCRV